MRRESALFKLFSFGTILGLIATAVLLHFVPPVNQGRERSIISVLPNGGNQEIFHVNLPADRIMVGAPGIETPVPATLAWPNSPALQGSQVELFKIRNAEDRIVGVASRLAVGGAAPFVEWTLHLPARGSIYALLAASPAPGGGRAGSLRAATRELEPLQGLVHERYIAAGDDADGITGRLEIATSLVGPAVEPEPEPIAGEEVQQ